MNTIQNMQSKNFKLLLLGDFVSSLGSNITSIAIMMIVYQKTQDIFFTSLFVLVNLIPQVILTPFIGKVNFDLSYRTIFVIGELLCALLLGILLINDSIAVIFILFSFFSIIFFMLECYRAEYMKVISTKKSIYKFQSISRIVNMIVTLVGPMLAGLLMVFVGNKAIYTLDIITYIIAAFIIFRISPYDKPKPKATNQSIKRINLMLTGNSSIYLGSIVITFIGGATSILTLSYIMDILKSSELHYTILISCMALGGIVGNALINIPAIKVRLKQISVYSTLFMGVLLMSVIFEPGYIMMLFILTISGLLSSFVMIYYATEIYLRYREDEIREKYAYFQNIISVSTAASKPVGGILAKKLGVLMSLFFMGVTFVIVSPINIFMDRVFKISTE